MADIPINTTYTTRQGGWIVHLMPYAAIKRINPVFGYELRRLAFDTTQLPRRSVLMAIWGMILPLLLWGAIAVLSLVTEQYMDNLYEAISRPLIALFFAIILLNVVLMDSYTLRAAVTGMADDFPPERWGLVVLTALPLRRIVLARYAITQLRLWSPLCLIVGARLGLAVMLPLHLILLLMLTNTPSSSLPPVLRMEATYMQVLVFAVSYVVIAGTLVIEPLWRLRALAAASVATSAYSREPSPRFTYGVVSIVVFTVIHWSVIALMLAVYYLDFANGQGFGALVVMFVPLLLYTVDRRMTEFWLNRAKQHLLNLEF